MSKQAETNARNGNAVEPTKVAQVIADAFPNRAPVIWLVATPSFWARMASLLSDRNLDRLIARNLGIRGSNIMHT